MTSARAPRVTAHALADYGREIGDTPSGMDLSALIEDLRRTHRVHTLLLYGSRARGDATSASDTEVAGFDASFDTLEALVDQAVC